jgi:hypothetical protein
MRTHVNGHQHSTRILAVVDWSVDPRAVVDSLRAQAEHGAAVGLLVPARLPGLDWIGDPYATRPCAERQLAELERLARQHGVGIERATIADPERVGAIRDTLEGWPADRIMLFDRRRVLAGNPLSVARRVARASGRVVERLAMTPAPRAGRRLARRAPRCSPAHAHAG